MPSFLKFFGFDLAHPLTLEEMISRLSVNPWAQVLPKYQYIRLSSKQGYELWFGSTPESSATSFSTHFQSASRQKTTLTDRFHPADSALEGVFKCRIDLEQAVDVRNLGPGESQPMTNMDHYSLLFQPPNYHWYDHLTLPAEVCLHLIGYPESVTLFPQGTQRIPASDNRPDAPCYFLIPVGAINQQENGKIFPIVELGGTILSVNDFVNPFSHIKVWVISVETVGLTLDLLIPTDMIDQTPKPGMVVNTLCWLSGEILEVFGQNDGRALQETAWIFQQACEVAGVRYYAAAEHALDFHFWDRLNLVREPQNPHDPKAVAVFTSEGEQIGYVPRRRNRYLSAMMDQGIPVRAHIFNKENSTDQPVIQMRIYSQGAYLQD